MPKTRTETKTKTNTRALVGVGFAAAAMLAAAGLMLNTAWQKQKDMQKNNIAIDETASEVISLKDNSILNVSKTIANDLLNLTQNTSYSVFDAIGDTNGNTHYVYINNNNSVLYGKLSRKEKTNITETLYSPAEDTILSVKIKLDNDQKPVILVSDTNESKSFFLSKIENDWATDASINQTSSMFDFSIDSNNNIYYILAGSDNVITYKLEDTPLHLGTNTEYDQQESLLGFCPESGSSDENGDYVVTKINVSNITNDQLNISSTNGFYYSDSENSTYSQTLFSLDLSEEQATCQMIYNNNVNYNDSPETDSFAYNGYYIPTNYDSGQALLDFSEFEEVKNSIIFDPQSSNDPLDAAIIDDGLPGDLVYANDYLIALTKNPNNLNLSSIYRMPISDLTNILNMYDYRIRTFNLNERTNKLLLHSNEINGHEYNNTYQFLDSVISSPLALFLSGTERRPLIKAWLGVPSDKASDELNNLSNKNIDDINNNKEISIDNQEIKLDITK